MDSLKPDINRRGVIGYLLVVIISILLYGNTLLNGYSFDDYLVTYNNALTTQGISALPEIFTTTYLDEADIKVDYRPMVKASFAVEHELVGSNPAVSHFINLLLYSATGLLVFWILSNLFAGYSMLFPFLVTCLFLFHPVHTEVVSSLKNRDEMLSFLFGLLALTTAIKFCKIGRYWLLCLTALFLFLGALSKITAFAFLAAIPVILFFFKLGSRKQLIWIIVAIVGSAVVYALLVYFMLPPYSRHFVYLERPIAFEKDFFVKTASIFYALGYYLKLLFFPHPLSLYYGYNQIPMVGWNNGWAILSLLSYGALVFYGVRNFFKRKIPALGVVLFFIFIFPVSNVLYPIAGTIVERGLYAPVLGFSIALVFIIMKLCKYDLYSKKQKLNWKLVAIFTVMFGLMGFKTVSRNAHWKDLATLLQADIEHLPNSAKAHQLYAEHLHHKSKTANDNKHELLLQAVKHYKRSIAIYDGWALMHKRLGNIYYHELREPWKAVPHYKKELQLKPLNFSASMNLANCYHVLGLKDSAMYYLRETISIEPMHFEALNKLVNASYYNGDRKRAFAYNKKFMSYYPESEVPWLNLVNFNMIEHDTAQAAIQLEEVVKLNPNHTPSINFLYEYYKTNEPEKAAYYRQLLNNR